MGLYQTTFTTDGSVDALSADLLKLKAGDTESLSVIIDGFEDTDDIEVHLYAKLDPSDADSDPDTVHVEAELSTPARFTDARQADFSFTTSQVARLLMGRTYVVRVLVTRSGTDYSQTVMEGSIAAAYPGNTVVAPSDEAYLRALGDANTLIAAKAYADGLAGLGTITFSQISDRTTAATGITKLGTVSTGTWQATAIADSYLATIATAGKVSNSATTATSANTASAIVARDPSGNFSAGTITATFAGNVTGNLTGNVTGNLTGNGTGTWTGSVVGNASTATLATTATTATSANTATLAATATALATPRTINGVSFDGTANITVTADASTLSGTTLKATVVTSSLTSVGTLTGGAIGSGFTAIADSALATIATAGKVSNSATTATANNTASAIVARDSSGNFTAGTITATSFVGTLTGNVTGNVTGGLTGNASTATNVAASGITGTTLASNVVTSSLTTVGILASPHMTSAVVDSGGLTVTAGSIAAASGTLGIGVSAPSVGNGIAAFQGSFTNVTNIDGVVITPTTSATVNGTYDLFGLSSQMTNQIVSAGVTDLGARTGVTGDAYASTASFAGTLTTQIGVRGRAGIVLATSGAVVTNAYGGYFEIRNSVAGTTLTNAYGIYINNAFTGGTITNRWDVYASSANAQSYFAGNVILGSALTMTAAASKLVPGATSFSHRNNADNADNLLISDAGAVTIRAGLTLAGGITSTTTSGSGTLLNTTATTNQKFVQLANTGNSGFYFGIESSAAGGFFSGSQAYESVLYSTGKNIRAITPVLIANTDFRIATPTVPATAGATGTAGDIAWDTGFVYVCTAANTWKRAAIATW